MLDTITKETIAVVIPCYNVKDQILGVLAQIGPTVDHIYVVDDCCPQKSGEWVKDHCHDPRVKIIFNLNNLGVGGAMIKGYREALKDRVDIIVKIDGDGQMNAELIPYFVAPIISGDADYTKGNRFYHLEDVQGMPATRLIGNACLSFLTKFSSGYWNLFDPTNGFTAIHATVLANLPLNKINQRYFFESDMLFRLNIIRAKVLDIPMHAIYANEKSNLKISQIFFKFFKKNLVNGFKRIFYNYFLRDFSLASLELIFGSILMTFGLIFGSYEWISHAQQQTLTNTGTVMLAVLPLLTGLQFLISFINHDMLAVPTQAINPLLRRRNFK